MRKKLQSHLNVRSEMYELAGVTTTKMDSRPGSAASRHTQKKLNQYTQEELRKECEDLMRTLEELKQKNKDLDEAARDRQDRYVRREQEYRKIIHEYEERIQGSSNSPPLLDSTHKNVERASEIHAQILDKLGVVQTKTAFLLKDQERTVAKDFNSKLTLKQEELMQEKELQQRSREKISVKESQLKEELERRKAAVEKIEATNKALHKQNDELKIDLKVTESEIPMMEKKLISLRAKNAQLKQEVMHSPEASPIHNPTNENPFNYAAKTTGNIRRPQSGVTRDTRYDEVINKLKRMLELERKNLRAAKTAYSRELEARKELENLLRDCVDDVKNDITRKRSEQRTKHTEEEVQEIENIIEVLLSQERVLTLLYDKAFPPRAITKENQDMEGKLQANVEYLEKHLQTIEDLYTKYEDIA